MKMKNSCLRLVVLAALLPVFTGCTGNRTVKNPAKLLGRTMTLPLDVWQESTGGRGSKTLAPQAEFRILAYFDKQGCTECRLNELANWQDLINETERLRQETPVSVDFLFVFQAAPDNPAISAKIKEVGFTAPIFFDPAGEFARRNVLPENTLYHAFLLDRDNRIVLVGAPIFSPKLWARYKAKLTGTDEE
jgi:hypothetical protein